MALLVKTSIFPFDFLSLSLSFSVLFSSKFISLRVCHSVRFQLPLRFQFRRVASVIDVGDGQQRCRFDLLFSFSCFSLSLSLSPAFGYFRFRAGGNRFGVVVFFTTTPAVKSIFHHTLPLLKLIGKSKRVPLQLPLDPRRKKSARRT